MNRTNIVNAIKSIRENEAAKLKMSETKSLVEVLEEIASEENIKMLRNILKLNLDSLRGNISLVDYGKLIGLMESVQVPKEVVYAYPMTMSRHFSHYRDKYFGGLVPNKNDLGIRIYDTEKDDFGCGWTKFTGPKELVDYLRENNVPIKVIE